MLPEALECYLVMKTGKNPFDAGIQRRAIRELPAGDVLIQLAQVHTRCRKYKKAEDLLQRALAILADQQGSDCDRTARAFNCLAQVYIERGKYSKAQDLCRQSLDVFENLFGEDHPGVADVLATLVQLNRKTGNTSEVARLQKRMEEIRERRHVAYLSPANTID